MPVDPKAPPKPTGLAVTDLVTDAFPDHSVTLSVQFGEILGLAAVPSVNPNDPSGARERGVRNRVVTDPFEPGSTVKPFTLAAAIEAGAVRPSDEWNCEGGQWRLGHVTLHDAEPEGILNTAQVLARSSNICTAKIARRLGKDKLYLFLRNVGFFAPTGVDLPGERAGQVLPVADWGDIAFANIAFGQGMTATPLQLAAGLAAIANGGTLYRPRIVRRIISPTGQTLLDSQPEGKRAMSARTAEQLQKMLRAVMEKKGTGAALDIPGYPVAGKTGTAQKVDPNTRHYSPEFWASSFMGYAPADNPRLLLFVMIDEPQEGHYGAAVAGPVFVKVMSAALPYLGVPPQVNSDGAAAHPAAAPPAPATAAAMGPPAPQGVTAESVPNFIGLGLGRALDLAQQAKLLQVLEEGTVRPLGANRAVPVDARIIAATHRDLRALVRERRFREDLYYRLDVVSVTLPALRHLHGRLPGARDLLRELLGGYRRQPGQGGRDSRGGRGEAAHPGAGRADESPGCRKCAVVRAVSGSFPRDCHCCDP